MNIQKVLDILSLIAKTHPDVEVKIELYDKGTQLAQFNTELYNQQKSVEPEMDEVFQENFWELVHDSESKSLSLKMKQDKKNESK